MALGPNQPISRVVKVAEAGTAMYVHWKHPISSRDSNTSPSRDPEADRKAPCKHVKPSSRGIFSPFV